MFISQAKKGGGEMGGREFGSLQGIIKVCSLQAITDGLF